MSTGGSSWRSGGEPRRPWRILPGDELPLTLLPLLLVAFLAVFGLGAWGFAADDRPLGDDLYHSLQLFVLEPELSELNWQLELARFLAPAVATLTLLLAAALVLRGWLRSLRVRLFFRGHIVVAGRGPDAVGITRAFAASGRRVVALAEGAPTAWMQECEAAGAVPLTGVLSDPETFRRVRVHRAEYAFLLCESDARSIEAGEAAQLAAMSHRQAPVQIFTKITDPELRIHRAGHGLGQRNTRGPSFDVLDPVDVAARLLVEERGSFLNAARPGAPRALVGGSGPIGEALMLHLARAWQRRRRDGGERLRLTLVDPSASAVVATLQARYRELEELCVLDPRDQTPDGPEWLRGEPFAEREGSPVDACFVCGDDEESVIRPALSAHYHLRGSGATLTACTAGNSETARAVLDDLRDAPLPSVYSVIELACAPEIALRGTRELLARATHEDYVRRELARGGSPEANPSLVGWDQLSEDLREANRAQADHVSVKLSELGCAVVPAVFHRPREGEEVRFSAEEIERLAEAEHDRWVEERRSRGYVYGETKDPERKIHPLLVPWDGLPDSEKEKDRDTVRDLPRRLELLGFAVVQSSGSPRPAQPPGA